MKIHRSRLADHGDLLVLIKRLRRLIGENQPISLSWRLISADQLINRSWSLIKDDQSIMETNRSWSVAHRDWLIPIIRSRKLHGVDQSVMMNDRCRSADHGYSLPPISQSLRLISTNSSLCHYPLLTLFLHLLNRFAIRYVILISV